MAPSHFLRWARWIGLLAGPLAVSSLALVIVSEVSSGGSVEAMEGSITGLLGGVLGLAGAIALLVGLFAVYLHQHDRLGGLGHFGFFVAVAGAVMSAGGVWSQVFVVPYLIAEAPELLEQGAGPVLLGYVLSYSMLGAGALLLAIATMRARAFPRWTSILAVVGAVLCLAPLPSRYFLFAVAVSVWAAHVHVGDTPTGRARVPVHAA